MRCIFSTSCESELSCSSGTVFLMEDGSAWACLLTAVLIGGIWRWSCFWGWNRFTQNSKMNSDWSGAWAGTVNVTSSQWHFGLLFIKKRQTLHFWGSVNSLKSILVLAACINVPYKKYWTKLKQIHTLFLELALCATRLILEATWEPFLCCTTISAAFHGELWFLNPLWSWGGEIH